MVILYVGIVELCVQGNVLLTLQVCTLILFRIWLDPMDFDYFTSVVRSEDEAKLDGPEYTPSRRRLLGGGHLLNIVYDTT